MKNSHWKLFFVASLAFAFGGLTGSALGVVWIYIQSDFGMPLSALGILVTVTTVGRLISSFSSGSLIGRFGIVQVLIIGTAVTTLGMFAFAFAPIWIFIVLAGFLSGAGAGVLGTGINAFAAVHLSSSQMNWLHGSFGIGATIGPLIITTLVIDLNISWQWAYILFAVLRVGLILLFFLTRDEWSITADPDKEARKKAHVDMTDTLRMPIMWLLIAIFLVATSIEMTTGQYANNLLVEGRGIDPKTAGTWVSLYWGSLTVSRFLVGFIIERVSNGVFLRLNMIGILIGALLLWLNLSPIASFLGLAIIGFTIAPFAPLMTSDTPLRVGTAHTANAIGFQYTGVGVGLAVLPWLAGVLAENFGLEIIPPFVLVIGLVTFVLHEIILRWDSRQNLKPSLTG